MCCPGQREQQCLCRQVGSRKTQDESRKEDHIDVNSRFGKSAERGYENLASFSQEELKMGVVDNLSLEIQRSMDYFESQLRQGPVKKVYISLNTLHQDALVDMIKQVIFVSVETFIPDVTSDGDMPIKASSLASLGAAIDNASLIA